MEEFGNAEDEFAADSSETSGAGDSEGNGDDAGASFGRKSDF
jgi:hypothetical protein